VTRSSYPNCAADTVLYTISDGGGHTWPATPDASPGNGTTTKKISANTLMWQFFQRFTLPT
jgi:polyhydroxybutyrate depolymerase